MSEERTESPGVSLANEMYAEPEAVVEIVSDSEEVETEEAHTETTTESTDNEVVEVAGEEVPEGEVEISSLAELAEHLETDQDFLSGLKIAQKVNGRDVEFSINQAIDTHMKVAAGDDYLADAKTQAKGIIEEANQQRDSIVGIGAVFGELVQTLEAEINGTEEDWNKLRRDDPAEYAARRDEQRERQAKLEAIKQQAAGTAQQTAAATEEQYNKQLEESLPVEREILLERVPEWKDAEKASHEQQEVYNWLTADGYSPEDIKIASYNGKLMSLAVKAMRYDQSKQKSEAAKKKVTTIPKILKPGTKKDASNASEQPTDRVGVLYG